MGDAREDCCKDETNREVIERKRTPSGVLVTEQCSECDRKHYIAHAEPAHFGVVGKGLTR